MTMLAQSLVAGYAIAGAAGVAAAGPYGLIAGVGVAWLGGGALSLALVTLRYAALPAETVDAMVLRSEDSPVPEIATAAPAPVDNASEFALWDDDLADEREQRDIMAEFETGRRTA
ncbi:MAG: hypothetical protein AAF317_01360 [Pseudomonadota bacterium]